jgi:2-desacetyl-2-hydroxyethyl bacteriochlorophyllide A dehydrogenase
MAGGIVQSLEALVCVEPGTLRIERRRHTHVDQRQALVRPRRVGICGTDYHIFEGKHPFLQYPRIMGHELAVEVVEAPDGSGLSPGEAYVVNPYLACGRCIACLSGKPNCCVKLSVLGVHQDGGMTELLSLPPGNLIHAPGLTLDECATVEFLAIGAHAVRRGFASHRDRVLVLGAGPIGLGVALLSRLSGSKVAIFDRDLERALVAESLAGATVSSTAGDPQDLVDAFTNGEGFDLVFDATGNRPAMEAGFRYVANGGRYVLVGVVNEPISFMDPDFHRKEMTLLASRNATGEDFERVVAAIRGGDVPVNDLITHRTSLAGAVRDIPRWATQKSGLIKAIVELD